MNMDLMMGKNFIMKLCQYNLQLAHRLFNLHGQSSRFPPHLTSLEPLQPYQLLSLLVVKEQVQVLFAQAWGQDRKDQLFKNF